MSAAAPRADLLRIFAAALAAVDGRAVVRRHLEGCGLSGSVTLVAVGKAAGAMALGARDALGAAIRTGLVIGKSGHLDRERLAALGLEALEAGHPVPDAASLEAGRRLLRWLAESSREDTLLFLLSGGASSLVEVPAAGLGLAELERAAGWLLGSGLAIDAVNRVRKCLSAIKGGGLLHWIGGRRVRALALSDVPGDDPAVIGSGLLVPDPDLAWAVAALALPDWLRAWTRAGLAERRGPPLPPAPGIALCAHSGMAQAAAAAEAQRLGYQVQRHDAPVQGDAAVAGRTLARALLQGPPGVQVWGGETTVVLPPHPGRGGRCQHLALAAALELAGQQGVWLLSAGTDGSDGPTGDAGALVDAGTLGRAALDGPAGWAALAAADSAPVLEAAGDLIRTGPTGTNVMDLMLGLKTEVVGGTWAIGSIAV